MVVIEDNFSEKEQWEGVMSLVLAVLGICLYWTIVGPLIVGIIAILMGRHSLKFIHEENLKGDMFPVLGILLGITSIIVFLVNIFFIIVTNMP